MTDLFLQLLCLLKNFGASLVTNNITFIVYLFKRLLQNQDKHLNAWHITLLCFHEINKGIHVTVKLIWIKQNHILLDINSLLYFEFMKVAGKVCVGVDCLYLWEDWDNFSMITVIYVCNLLLSRDVLVSLCSSNEHEDDGWIRCDRPSPTTWLEQSPTPCIWCLSNYALD